MDLSLRRMAAMAAMAVFGLALGFAGVTEARDIDERRLVRRSHGGDVIGSARGEGRHERGYGNNERHGGFESGRRWRVHDRVPEYNEDRFLQPRRAEHGRSQSWHAPSARPDSWSNRNVIRDYRTLRFRYDGYDDGRDGFSVYPSIVVGSGTFSGDVSTWYERGNGSYFTLERHGLRETGRTARAEGRRSRSRIIDARSRSGNEACSYEAGVCVIRGQ